MLAKYSSLIYIVMSVVRRWKPTLLQSGNEVQVSVLSLQYPSVHGPEMLLHWIVQQVSDAMAYTAKPLYDF